MKRSCRANPSALAALLLFVTLTAPCFGEGAADPNALLAFKKLYIEPIRDNVDGAFQAPITESYKKIFDRNPRFELVTDKGLADTLVRTVIEKKATGTDLDITVLLAATGEIFTSEHDTIPVTASGGETGQKMEALLKAALKRIPFYGTVTGRDGQELTFDIGAQHGLRKGDTIQISRVDNIKRHPLLKSIVDTQLVPVGDAVIDSAEETISFGHVKSEITAEKIQKLNKVTAIEARAVPPAPPRTRELEPEGRVRDYAPQSEPGPHTAGPPDDQDRPHLGYVGIGLQLSSFTSSASQVSTVNSVSGGGFSPGARVNGELWFTKNWFADMGLGLSAVSYSNSAGGSGTSYSTSTHSFQLAVGYRYLTEGNLYGPQISAKFGYMNWGWSTPISPVDLLASTSYSGADLGIGGSLPISSYDWGLTLDVNIMLFAGFSQDNGLAFINANSSASGATFFFGGYHYFNRKLAVRAGPLVEVFSANDSVGDSTSQKTFGLVTTLLYYF